MKGMVFTEFLDMVEERFSADVVDKIIDASNLPSKGQYTAVGTYDHTEMLALVTELARETSLPAPVLVKAFGEHLFTRFAKGYPGFFNNVTDAFTFLDNVEGYIHIEVRKLYPDAQLPTFATSRTPDGKFVMEYRSERGFADLAHGLITGCVDHYGGGVRIGREDLSADSRHVRFVLERS